MTIRDLRGSECCPPWGQGTHGNFKQIRAKHKKAAVSEKHKGERVGQQRTITGTTLVQDFSIFTYHTGLLICHRNGYSRSRRLHLGCFGKQGVRGSRWGTRSLRLLLPLINSGGHNTLVLLSTKLTLDRQQTLSTHSLFMTTGQSSRWKDNLDSDKR